jgi:hypothetical protein
MPLPEFIVSLSCERQSAATSFEIREGVKDCRVSARAVPAIDSPERSGLRTTRYCRRHLDPIVLILVLAVPSSILLHALSIPATFE